MERHKDIQPNYRVRILMPNVGAENIEALKDNKPFVMRADLELGAQFIQVVSTPTLVDMMGFSGGGGPPAYAFLVHQRQVDKQQVVFISLAPNTPFYLPVASADPTSSMRIEDPDVRWVALGVTQAMGALLTHFMLTGSGLDDEVLKSAREKNTAVVVEMIDYQIPEMLLGKILPDRLRQMKPSM